MTLPGLWSMSIIDKWFWIVTLYDNKRDILISGMILSGIYCICIYMSVTLLVPQRAPLNAQRANIGPASND